MRKVTYGAATSLDSYIADPDDAVDWLHWSDDVRRVSGTYFSRVDTVLMGRKTYDVARAVGGGAYPGVTNYVFSRTLRTDPEPNVYLVREDATEFVRALKGQPGREICVMGGGDFARTLLEAGLIDEIGANIHPILLGAGKPLVPPLQKRVTLELINLEQLAGGCAYVLYRVLGH